jgi:hypothetical protein
VQVSGRAVTLSTTIPGFCFRPETTMASEVNDLGDLVAAITGGDALTNLEAGNGTDGPLRCHSLLIERDDASASTFITLSCERNLSDKNEPYGLLDRQVSPLEPEKE